MKWFDLSTQGAKLESVRNADGVFSLQIELKETISEEKLKEAVKNGWVAKPNSEGKILNNYSMFTKLSGVRTSLTPFFDAAIVDGLIVEATDLRQGEKLEAYEPFIRNPKAASTMAVIDSNIAPILSRETRERIKARILGAQKFLGLTNSNERLFDGRGVDVWKSLSSKFGYEAATGVMIASIERAEAAGDVFKKFYDDVINAEAGGELPKLDSNIDGYAKNVINHFKRDFALLKKMDGSCEEGLFYQQFIRDTGCIYNVWDSAKFNHVEDFNNNIKNVKYTSDPAMPLSWKNDFYSRIDQALKTVGKIIDLPHQKMFQNECVIHLNKFIGHGKNGGMAALNQFSDLKYYVIRVTPYMAGSFVHELGHMLDFQYLLNEENPNRRKDIVDRLLIKTGVDKYIDQVVDLLSTKQKEYYKNPYEKIARTFEMSIANELRSDNDRDFLTAGGLATINGGFCYTPPPDLCKEFLAEFKTQIHNSLNFLKEKAIENTDTEEETLEVSAQV